MLHPQQALGGTAPVGVFMWRVDRFSLGFGVEAVDWTKERMA